MSIFELSIVINHELMAINELIFLDFDQPIFDPREIVGMDCGKPRLSAVLFDRGE